MTNCLSAGTIEHARIFAASTFRPQAYVRVRRRAPGCASDGRRAAEVARESKSLRRGDVRDRQEHWRSRRRVPALVRTLLDGQRADRDQRRSESSLLQSGRRLRRRAGYGQGGFVVLNAGDPAESAARFLTSLLHPFRRWRRPAIARHDRRSGLGDLAGGLRSRPPLGGR